MTMFSPSKIQESYKTNHSVLRSEKKNTEILQGESSALEKIKEYARIVTMDKKRLRLPLTALNAIKTKYPETKQFIDNTMEDNCQKEKISADEVIFFTSLGAKSQLRKTFFVLQQVC